jgi:23S rRNA pseudouridine955/2504/2580 synthase
MSESTKNSPAVRFIDITQEEAGQRIDNYLMRELKGAPKSYVYRILRKGEVRVNKGRVKAHYKLSPGDSVRLPPMRLAVRADQKGNISDNLKKLLSNSVVYEDDRMLVVNKPSGLAVHGGSGVNFGVIEVLRQLRPEEKHLELVHRLDRDTSGCLLISKKRSALRTLHELIRENRIDKRYLTLLHGSWRKGVQTVDMPLKKNTLQGGERVVRVDVEGKPSKTIFRRIERFAEASLIEAELITGRTHQIRVHSQWLGSPVLGDPKYGDAAANRAFRDKGLKRLFLHAFKLGLRWPGEKKQLIIEAPLPEALSDVLQKLKS